MHIKDKSRDRKIFLLKFQAELNHNTKANQKKNMFIFLNYHSQILIKELIRRQLRKEVRNLC